MKDQDTQLLVEAAAKVLWEHFYESSNGPWDQQPTGSPTVERAKRIAAKTVTHAMATLSNITPDAWQRQLPDHGDKWLSCPTDEIEDFKKLGYTVRPLHAVVRDYAQAEPDNVIRASLNIDLDEVGSLAKDTLKGAHEAAKEGFDVLKGLFGKKK